MNLSNPGPMIEKKNILPVTPGIGVAGMVMCPFGFQKGPCLKSGCELWVELTYDGGTPNERCIGRCALAWNAMLTAENTQQLIKLTEVLKAK